MTDDPRVAPLVDAHRETWSAEPVVLVRAPGRANLIGEHVDYHGGPVLPMAIDRALLVAASPLPGDRLAALTLPLGERAEGTLETAESLPAWAAAIVHATAELRRAGIRPRGLAITAGGDLPTGAGLSSSAAWLIAVAAALREISGAGCAPDPATWVDLVREIELSTFGVPCGAMDPLAVLCGEEGCALAIETASGTVAPVPLPGDLAIALIDTGTRRRLDDGRYAERRRESEAAARALGRPDLRGATLSECTRLPPPLAARAAHVVSEIARVGEAVAALRDGDRARFGALLDESHASLRDRYEVSSPALDAAVEIARAHPAALGARLTGAGFAGAAIAAVATEGSARFLAEVAPELAARLGPAATVALVHPSAGAELLAPSRRRLTADRRSP